MSSGNLTADRRFAYAQLLRRDGDAEAAADVLSQTLELVPDWAEGRFALAEALTEAGRKHDAIPAFEAYLEIDPADSMGAAVKLALLTEVAPRQMPEAYLRRLFDEYAPRFEKSLLEKLNYRAPEILRAAVDAVQPDGTFARVFDLGCGTGLMGVAIKDRATWLGGADLAPAMVRGAENKNIYDYLDVSEMVIAVDALAAPCDLMLAADVLAYVGDLTSVLRAVRRKLTPGGLFAFTVQRHDDEGFVLGAEHRFSHSRAYIENLAKAEGYATTYLENAVSRQEKGVDVPGLAVILRAA
jgi:predicted TPR repeat methyltransferase